MNKYVFVYYGSKTASNISEKERGMIMDAWKAWFGSMGDKLVDGGNPFAENGMSVTAGKTEAIAADMWPAKGYSIVNAVSMDEAVKMAKRCPALKDDPDGSVRVYETIPM
jgi:hypothetical protein